MKIAQNTDEAVVITLSESNVAELFYMMEQAKIGRARGRLQNAQPFLFKNRGDGATLVVQIERDATHYPVGPGVKV